MFNFSHILILFCLTVFPSFCHFPTSPIKFILWNSASEAKVFYRQGAGRGHGVGKSVLGTPHRVLFGSSINILNIVHSPLKVILCLHENLLFSFGYV